MVKAREKARRGTRCQCRGVEMGEAPVYVTDRAFHRVDGCIAKPLPPSPLDVATAERDAALADAARLADALKPFAVYAEMRERKPIRGLDDVIHQIHCGSEWEAAISLTDCEAARAALRLHEEAAR